MGRKVLLGGWSSPSWWFPGGLAAQVWARSLCVRVRGKPNKAPIGASSPLGGRGGGHAPNGPFWGMVQPKMMDMHCKAAFGVPAPAI